MSRLILRKGKLNHGKGFDSTFIFIKLNSMSVEKADTPASELWSPKS